MCKHSSAQMRSPVYSACCTLVFHTWRRSWVVASFLIILVFPAAGETSTLTGQLTGEPFWLPEIMAGLLLGWFAYETVPSKTAFFGWLVPGCFLLWKAWSWQRSIAAYDDSTLDTYFGRNCGGSECLYQLFFTVPFYSSLSYSIGAFSKYVEARRTEARGK